MTCHTFAAPVGFGSHHHPEHQIAWMRTGRLRVEAAGRTWYPTRSHVIWIPGGLQHEMTITTPGTFVSAYAHQLIRPPGQEWDHPRCLELDDLAESLLLRLADRRLSDALRGECQRLLYDLLEIAIPASGLLGLPADPRARVVAEAIVSNPADDHDLSLWAQRLQVSAKTLSRGFSSASTSFRQWRTQARLEASLPLLESGLGIEQVALRVGYANASAFIAAFQRAFGTTPARHRSRFPNASTGRKQADG